MDYGRHSRAGIFGIHVAFSLLQIAHPYALGDARLGCGLHAASIRHDAGPTALVADAHLFLAAFKFFELLLELVLDSS